MALTVSGHGNFGRVCDRLEVRLSQDQPPLSKEVKIFESAKTRLPVNSARGRIEYANTCLLIRCRQAICFPSLNSEPVDPQP